MSSSVQASRTVRISCWPRSALGVAHVAGDGVEPLLRRRGSRIEQALLGTEVVVDQRRVDVGGPGDSPDCRAGPAVFGEFLASGGQDARCQHATLVTRARGG